MPIRGGRGAPGTPPAGRAGRGAGAWPSGRAGAVAPSWAAAAAGRSTGAGALAAGADVGAWNPGPAEPVTGADGAAGAGAAAAGATRGGATDRPAGRGEVTGGVAADGAAAAGAVTDGAVTDGADTEGADAAGADSAGNAEGAGLLTVGVETGGVAVAGAAADAAPGRATGAGPGAETVGRGATEPGRPAPPLGALLGAADPLVGRSAFAPAGLVAGKASRNLRTTGASIVEDGDLTNSPIWLSFAMISLLVLPSSFASSCTRALPATALLRVRAAAGSERPLALRCAGCCSLLLHGVLTLGRPAFWFRRLGDRLPAAIRSADPAVSWPSRKIRTSVMSSVSASILGTRRALPNARRRSAAARHPRSGCNHAPLPGSRRRRSGITTPSTATTRSNAVERSRTRQPTHVRSGPGDPEVSTAVAGVDKRPDISVYRLRVRMSDDKGPRQGAPAANVPERIRALRWRGRTFRAPHRCGCRSATRSAARPAWRSAPLCRSPVTTGSPGPPPGRRGRPRRRP